MAAKRKHVSPMNVLDEDEALFAQYVAHSGMSYYDAFKVVKQDAEPNNWRRDSDNFAKRPRVQAAIKYLSEATDTEAAADFLRQQLHSPSATVAAKKSAAETIMRVEERAAASEGFDRWMAKMTEVGAVVRMPIPDDGLSEVTIALTDLLDGRAYMALPGKARLELLRQAGAPWNEEDPNARLSPLQNELLLRDERMVFCSGGSGVGKSATQGCAALVELVLPNRKIAIIASTYDKCFSEFQYAWKGFMELFGLDGACTTRQSFIAEKRNYNMQIDTIWGSSLECFSTEHEQGAAILGREFDLVIYGEGALVSPEIHQRKVVRALMRRVKRRTGTRDPDYYRKTGRVYGCTTPDGFGGLVSDEWDRVIRVTKNNPALLHADVADNWLDTVYLREAAAIENPSYSVEAFEAARRALPNDIFAEQMLGKRIRRSGIIYKEWEEAVMLVPRPSPEAIGAMRLSVGFDTGKHFSASVMGLDTDGRLWRLGETCSVEQKISDNADQVRELVVAVLGEAYGETTFEGLRPHVDIWPCDPHSQHKMELMDELGVPIMDAVMPVQGSIDRLRKLMSEGSFFVVKDHAADPIQGFGFLWEIGQYVWKVVKTAKGWNDGRTKLEPVKMNDHSMDEIRYASIPLLDLGKPQKKAVVQSRAPSLGNHLRAQMGRFGRARSMGEGYRGIHA